MENRENPIFGRKVFFVNPPISIAHFIVDSLHDQEYEVYVIDDYQQVKPILRENKDALCFIYIDNQLTYKQWFNFINSFYDDEVLRTIFVGILSTRATASDSQFFLMNLPLAGGFNFIPEKVDKMLDKIVAILDMNGAKGNRKYVRLNCSNLNNVNAYFAHNSKLFSLKILNISSVGLACSYNSEVANIFQPNTVYNNISVTIGRKTVVCPSVVLRKTDTEAVLLFTTISNDDRTEIKQFIHTTMTNVFADVKKNVIKDLEVYSPDIDMKLVELRNSQREAAKTEGLFGELVDADDLEPLEEL